MDIGNVLIGCKMVCIKEYVNNKCKYVEPGNIYEVTKIFLNTRKLIINEITFSKFFHSLVTSSTRKRNQGL